MCSNSMNSTALCIARSRNAGSGWPCAAARGRLHVRGRWWPSPSGIVVRRAAVDSSSAFRPLTATAPPLATSGCRMRRSFRPEGISRWGKRPARRRMWSVGTAHSGSVWVATCARGSRFQRRRGSTIWPRSTSSGTTTSTAPSTPSDHYW